MLPDTLALVDNDHVYANHLYEYLRDQGKRLANAS